MSFYQAIGSFNRVRTQSRAAGTMGPTPSKVSPHRLVSSEITSTPRDNLRTQKEARARFDLGPATPYSPDSLNEPSSPLRPKRGDRFRRMMQKSMNENTKHLRDGPLRSSGRRGLPFGPSRSRALNSSQPFPEGLELGRDDDLPSINLLTPLHPRHSSHQAKFQGLRRGPFAFGSATSPVRCAIAHSAAARPGHHLVRGKAQRPLSIDSGDRGQEVRAFLSHVSG